VKDIEQMIGEVLAREGGFVDHPADHGGATNFGITQAALAQYRGHAVSIDDVRNLTEVEARNIYRNRYLTSVQLHRIHDPYLLCLLFDCSVNHGPARAVRWLQKACGVPDDGVLGDQTEVAANSLDPVRLYQKILARRIVFYGEIISADHSQAIFALGWLRRAASFVEVA
jgi:lysozyme family protein